MVFAQRSAVIEAGEWIAVVALLALICATPTSAAAQNAPIVMPQGPPAKASPFTLKLSYAPTSRPVQGVGLIGVASGHPIDLLTPDTWSNEREGVAADTEVGVGWRRRNLSAVVGYVRPSSSTPTISAEDGPRFKTRSMMGLGFSLHY